MSSEMLMGTIQLLLNRLGSNLVKVIRVNEFSPIWSFPKPVGVNLPKFGSLCSGEAPRRNSRGCGVGRRGIHRAVAGGEPRARKAGLLPVGPGGHWQHRRAPRSAEAGEHWVRIETHQQSNVGEPRTAIAEGMHVWTEGHW